KRSIGRRPGHGFVDQIPGVKLQAGRPGEHSTNPHPYKVAILAVVVDPVLHLVFIRDLNASAVVLPVIPAMPLPVEALEEASCIPCRVTEHEPPWLAIGHTALSTLPDCIRDG